MAFKEDICHFTPNMQTGNALTLLSVFSLEHYLSE